MEIPYLGVGVGLRRPHFQSAMETSDGPDFFEVLSENYMLFGGRPEHVLVELKKKYPLVAHGTQLNLGGPVSPQDETYLRALYHFFQKIEPRWFSDHLCMTSYRGHHFHDLIPLERTPQTLDYFVSRIQAVQEKFNIPFAVENVSYYAESSFSSLGEAEYLARIVEQSECYLLLDINNIYVNALNHGLCGASYLDTLPLDRVIQVHLAGHETRGPRVIDTHGGRVCEGVWQLYELFLEKVNRPVSTLVEWDNALPSFGVLMEEAQKARGLMARRFPGENRALALKHHEREGHHA